MVIDDPSIPPCDVCRIVGAVLGVMCERWLRLVFMKSSRALACHFVRRSVGPALVSYAERMSHRSPSSVKEMISAEFCDTESLMWQGS